MSETQAAHTPGPWYATNWIDRFHNGEWIRAGDPRTGNPVAVCCDFNRTDRDAEREANARLIAAGPDLLEALQSAAGAIEYALDAGGFGMLHDQAIGTLARAKAAIAKATGSEP